jgi:2-isopropylmalate synthase
MDRIAIFDVTLRDGEQAPGFSMNTKEKLQFAHQLERLRVDVIEAGFPMASEGDFAAVRTIAGEIRETTVAGLCRSLPQDIERCWQALEKAKRPRIHTFLATSDIHLKHKLGKSREEAIELAVKGVTHAKRLCDNVEFSAEDSGRSEIEFLCRIFEAVIEAGATVINVPDTVGYTMPDEYGWMIRSLTERISNLEGITISTHCHNDLGLAVANSLAGARNGARQIECAINGIGERAGNASLEEVVMAIEVRKRHMNVYTGIDTREIYKTSRLLSEITGVDVQPNKAIVGRNAFAHEAGIHQDGVLKAPITYEIMTPESIGLPQNSIVLGKHSGRHALEARCQAMGHALSRTELERAYSEFLKVADRQKVVGEQDLLKIIATAASSAVAST